MVFFDFFTLFKIYFSFYSNKKMFSKSENELAEMIFHLNR
jgi:hypothetical protein